MPIPLTPEQLRIAALRRERAAAAARRTDSRSALHAAERALERLRRTGGAPPALERAAARLARARGEHAGILADIDRFDGEIGEIVNEVLGQASPESLLERLDGTLPIALLPVRLETRFLRPGGRTRLQIRIYPDQVHLDAHTPALLPQEIELGRGYWRARRGGEEQARTAWEAMCRTLTPTRALWAARSTRPAELDAAELDFPDPPQRLDAAGEVPQARLLPDRWVALGYRRQGAGYVETFRKWGAAVPDALNVTVAFDELSEAQDGDDALPIDEGMRWAVDYAEAERVGMAITVEAGDLAAGGSLDAGVDLLLVTGVDWTLSGEAAAEALADQLDAHQYSDGLAFVPQGVPTNNTASERSGFTTDPVALARLTDPAARPEVAEGSAAARLRAGLGLPADDRLAGAPHADLAEQATTSGLVEALWESTLGYFLDDLLDPLASDRFIDLARDHAAAHLQPFGPFAALRVGKQPYGLLPVLAPDAFAPDRSGGVEATLDRFLRVASWYWRYGLRSVPFMGRGDPDDDLLALLQRTPISHAKRIRRAVDAETAGNLRGLEAYARVQSDVLRSFVLKPFASFAGPGFHAGKIAQMVLSPTDMNLYGPWVQAALRPGEPLDPNYLRSIVEDVRAGRAGRARLHERTNSRVLLEALLAHAALRELDRASSRVVDEHLVAVGAIAEAPAKSSLQVRSLLGITATEEVGDGQVLVQTPEQQAALIVPQLTGSATTLADFVAEQIAVGPLPERPALRNLGTFVQALERLAEAPATEIDRATRAVLDCYSYRLDAWYTSLASRRLTAVREREPRGVHAGGYGWVRDLRPDTQPDSLGYVHAPSIAHAATAAVLRSGHLSHRRAANAGRPVDPGSPEAALAIDLDSGRVRTALALLEGVAQGQPLAALLGYRLERRLRERDALLAQFIGPLRRLAPLRNTVPEPEEAAESIAARDVVDGVRLLERWRAEGEGLLDRLDDPRPNGEQRRAIGALLDRLDATLDAVGDVLVSEAVFQTVRGNYERAGAALAALDRQERPPEPQVVRTPRSGLRYQQRVLVALRRADTPPPAWAGTDDVRSAAEPRLNAWLARLIGDPARFELSAVVRTGEAEVGRPRATLAEVARARRLSPLSLVLLSAAAGEALPSTLETVVAHHLAAAVADPQPDSTLDLELAPAEEGGLGLGSLLALLRLLGRAVGNPQPADARDCAPPGNEVTPNLDTDELRARLDTLLAALDAAVTALDAALERDDADALREALAAGFAFGLADALPELGDDASAERAASARATLAATAAAVAEAEADFAATGENDEEAVAAHLTAQVRRVLGEPFPVLPLFTAHGAAELEASRGDREALLAGDPFAPLTWLQQVATVRPEVERWVAALDASGMLGEPVGPDALQVAQLPHAPGQTWAALTRPAEEVEPLLALLTVGDADWSAPLAGLVVDGWAEMIPAASETTAISFHYDAPAARAPQALLLAVPPALGAPHWTFDALTQTLLHAHDLMQLRAVGPREVPVLGGGLLPMIYLPQDRTRQLPSVDLIDLARHWEALTTKVAGKMVTDAEHP